MVLSQEFVKDCAGKGEFMLYSRFAIYYIPPEGPLAEFGADWLGWDVVRGREAIQLGLPGLHDITITPRQYGFHATLKPPFRVQAGATAEDPPAAVGDLANTLAPATCDGLEFTTPGHFLTLTPRGDVVGVQRVAEACARGLNGFRAPATQAELARRRQAGLSPRQEALLMQWGYPYVMEEFRFHLTLSGR
jgi:hypothetical protein